MRITKVNASKLTPAARNTRTARVTTIEEISSDVALSDPKILTEEGR